MAPEPMSDEMREDLRRMTLGLANQSTIDLLTRVGNQAKYNRWDLKERKRAREEAMGRADSDAGDVTDASVADTSVNETGVTAANDTNATDVSEGKGKGKDKGRDAKVATKVKDVVARMSKAMNRLSMSKKGAEDKKMDDNSDSNPGHGKQQQQQQKGSNKA